MSPSGSFLEKYKIWYLDQPKLLRIVLLPAFVAIIGNALQLLSIDQQWKNYGMLFLGAMLVIVAYNQLIEADTLEEYRDLADEMELEALFWKKMYGDATFLNKLYSELVLRKSEMWREATLIASQKDRAAAIAYVREENSLKANINRIITLVHKAFERHMDVTAKEEVRVAYFVPSEDDSRLVLKSWCNSQFRVPHSITKNADAFAKNGKSLASFVWTRSGQEQFFCIDDVEKYVYDHKDTGVFLYLSNGQASTIRSIFCFRIVDGLSGNCLGVIAVDCNTKDIFSGRIGEDVAIDIVNSAGNRIVYETRFSAMKGTLGPYDKGD